MTEHVLFGKVMRPYESGVLVEIVRPVFWPLKLRVVQEEWYTGDVLIAVVPRQTQFTLLARSGRRELLRLQPVLGHVDVDRGAWA